MGTAILRMVRGSDDWKRIARRFRSRMEGWVRTYTRKAERPVTLEQTIAIGNRGTLALVSIAGKRVLVGVTNGCMQFHGVRSGPALELPVEGRVR